MGVKIVWRVCCRCQGHLDISICHRAMLAVRTKQSGQNLSCCIQLGLFPVTLKEMHQLLFCNRTCKVNQLKRTQTKDELWVACSFCKSLIILKCRKLASALFSSLVVDGIRPVFERPLCLQTGCKCVSFRAIIIFLPLFITFRELWWFIKWQGRHQSEAALFRDSSWWMLV